ncbi:hypothetical protein ACFX15_046117 [Malus domestica]
MAQDYVGSNNVNLFIPDAQFGTQIPEAKTMLVLIIYTLGFLLYQDSFFPRMMIYVLEHLSAYGKRVEPKSYFPIIPMVLVNGCERNLTAGSTYVPAPSSCGKDAFCCFWFCWFFWLSV